MFLLKIEQTHFFVTSRGDTWSTNRSNTKVELENIRDADFFSKMLQEVEYLYLWKKLK